MLHAHDCANPWDWRALARSSLKFPGRPAGFSRRRVRQEPRRGRRIESENSSAAEPLMADTPIPDEKRQSEVANHPQWDRKQGTPKDEKVAQVVERASSRYGASEQSEDKKDRKPR